MKIVYSKDSLKFLAKSEKSDLQKEIDTMLELLPDSEQQIVYEFVKRVVLAWDGDFTKTTPQEREQIERAEHSGFIPEDEIDWDNLDKYE